MGVMGGGKWTTESGSVFGGWKTRWTKTEISDEGDDEMGDLGHTEKGQGKVKVRKESEKDEDEEMKEKERRMMMRK
ncbi:hypothetical protein Pmani_032446 [Petrolisthes manimaculis]|uniref:Uncharacterized protein n=1 Tax=Petrolisthes manimaculis TaxID=1843537 RepID=A0AAE1TTS5_9EUCA|nr:hypothetical protein Pmani_032446 [Petrolisthes manimaculis]